MIVEDIGVEGDPSVEERLQTRPRAIDVDGIRGRIASFGLSDLLFNRTGSRLRGIGGRRDLLDVGVPGLGERPLAFLDGVVAVGVDLALVGAVSREGSAERVVGLADERSPGVIDVSVGSSGRCRELAGTGPALYRRAVLSIEFSFAVTRTATPTATALDGMDSARRT